MSFLLTIFVKYRRHAFPLCYLSRRAYGLSPSGLSAAIATLIRSTVVGPRRRKPNLKSRLFISALLTKVREQKFSAEPSMHLLASHCHGTKCPGYLGRSYGVGAETNCSGMNTENASYFGELRTQQEPLRSVTSALNTSHEIAPSISCSGLFRGSCPVINWCHVKG